MARRKLRSTQHLLVLALALAAPTVLSAQFSAHLSPRTAQAFEEYRKATEAKLDGKPQLDSAPKPSDITITPGNAKGSVEVKDGLVHDWIAATLVPNTTPEKALALLQDYADYKDVYSVDVLDSKVLSHQGDLWHVYLKVMKKKVLTAVLNSEFDVKYQPLGEGRWSVVSRSTRIAELDGAKELAPGEGHGFLWRLNAYWLIEPRPEGVYLECRSLSLSRDIPTGLGWLIKPFVTSVPKESLYETMLATLRALQ
jgi:hypothetical protein